MHGINAAKNAQKLKHIRKVKAAIRHQNEARERMIPILREKRAVRVYIKEYPVLAYQGSTKKEARKKAQEDWRLGPLRANMAVGEKKEMYGVSGRRQMYTPPVPKHLLGAGERVQKQYKTPLPKTVLRDQWPIVEGDRVVVIRGPLMNQVGIVKEVVKDNNQVHISGLNKIWLDSELVGEEVSAGKKKFEFEKPISYDDIRLLVPHDVYETRGNETVKVRQDVIVEDITMEKHTTGINPFTGEYQVEIPEEHQVDPTTGEVIWHRYIAGSRTPIRWPWEKASVPAETDNVGEAEATEQKKPGRIAGLLQKVNPLKLLGKGKKQKKAKAPSDAPPPRPAVYDPESMIRARPKNNRKDPILDDDTARWVVEIEETSPDYFVPTLVYPPMPETVIEELQDSHMANNVRRQFDEAAADAFKAQRKEYKEAKELAKQERINSMKTPMQIRWELEQAKKVKYDPKAPTAPSADLLAALGKHMAAKGIKLDKETMKAANAYSRMVKKAETEELAA